MKKLLGLFVLLFGVAACSGDTETREEVIERYSGGEKKIVAHYIGSGVNESLVERFVYDVDGDLLSKEDFRTNTKLNWGQLNPGLKTATGLQAYLKGSWIAEQEMYYGLFTKQVMKFSEEGIEWKSKMFEEGISVSEDDMEPADMFKVVYKPDYVINAILLSHQGDQNKEEDITLKVMAKNTFSFMMGETELQFHKM